MRLPVAMALACLAAAQPARFEVVSVKPAASGNLAPRDTECQNGHFVSGAFPVGFLVRWAWQLPVSRVAGLPEWANDWDSSFEGEAKGASGSAQECRLMVRQLLEDRFSLRAHLEDRPMRAFLLTTTDAGRRLRRGAQLNRQARINGQPVADSRDSSGLSMQGLAKALSGHPGVGRPVVDRTGLSGPFAFDLQFTSRDEDVEASVFTALRGLGLKLERATVPLPVLVVDTIQRPEPN